MGFWERIKDYFSPKPEVLPVEPVKPVAPIPPPEPKRSNDEIATIKMRMLIKEAEKWLNVREHGANKGAEVEMFQKYVSGRAVGQPWCADFIFYCIGKVDEDYERIYGSDSLKCQLYKSESALSIWNQSLIAARIKTNLHPGLISIWQHYRDGRAQTSGHVGIVKQVLDDQNFLTIEGNTTDHEAIDRDGDGVYVVKRRFFKTGKNFRLLGFLAPWQGQYLDSYTLGD